MDKSESMISHAHLLLGSGDPKATAKLPVINTEGIADFRNTKNGYGDLIIKDGEVVLDFWKIKLKMSIKNECIVVEQAESKKQIFAREDLPKKYYKLYTFAANMVDALKQKQKVQVDSSSMAGSQVRMSPQEIIKALAGKGRGFSVSADFNFQQVAAAGLAKAAAKSQAMSLKLGSSKS